MELFQEPEGRLKGFELRKESGESEASGGCELVLWASVLASRSGGERVKGAAVPSQPWGGAWHNLG